MNMGRFPLFVRNVAEKIKAATANYENRALTRKCADGVKVNSQASRVFNAVRKAQDFLRGFDTQSFSVLFVRCVTDNATVSQTNWHWGAFIRGLAVTAGSTAETTHKAE
jgi:hypothetical protein